MRYGTHAVLANCPSLRCLENQTKKPTLSGAEVIGRLDETDLSALSGTLLLGDGMPYALKNRPRKRSIRSATQAFPLKSGAAETFADEGTIGVPRRSTGLPAGENEDEPRRSVQAG